MQLYSSIEPFSLRTDNITYMSTTGKEFKAVRKPVTAHDLNNYIKNV